MKTIKFFLVVAFIATLSISTTYAKTSLVDDVIISNTTESVVVNLGNVGNRAITVKIVNETQDIIMTESVKNTSDFVKKYNVAALPSGHYNMVILRPNSRVTQPFSVQNGELSLSELDKKVKFFPAFAFKNDQLDVNVFLGYYGTITVNILDDEGNKIYTDKNQNTEKVHKRYNFSGVSRGTYSVEVIAGDETFYYSILK
jgi:hypothetical protein